MSNENTNDSNLSFSEKLTDTIHKVTDNGRKPICVAVTGLDIFVNTVKLNQAYKKRWVCRYC